MDRGRLPSEECFDCVLSRADLVSCACRMLRTSATVSIASATDVPPFNALGGAKPMALAWKGSTCSTSRFSSSEMSLSSAMASAFDNMISTLLLLIQNFRQASSHVWITSWSPMPISASSTTSFSFFSTEANKALGSLPLLGNPSFPKKIAMFLAKSKKMCL